VRIPGDIPSSRSWSSTVSPPVASWCMSRPISTPCQKFARNCATHNLASPHDTTSDRASTCAVMRRREVLHGVVNHPRIDGKDAVRQSALRPATAGHTAAVSWSATGSPDTADARGLGDRAIALRQPRVDHEAACLHHDQPNQSTALQLLQRCRLPNQPAPARALVITDEASPFALRSTRNHPRTAMRSRAAMRSHPSSIEAQWCEDAGPIR
jgi:hypothetical protein